MGLIHVRKCPQSESKSDTIVTVQSSLKSEESQDLPTQGKLTNRIRVHGEV